MSTVLRYLHEILLCTASKLCLSCITELPCQTHGSQGTDLPKVSASLSVHKVHQTEGEITPEQGYVSSIGLGLCVSIEASIGKTVNDGH